MIPPSEVALSSGSRLSTPAGELLARIVSGGCGAGAGLRVFREGESETLRLQPNARIPSIKNRNARDADDSFM
jgi:hypothetical protein